MDKEKGEIDHTEVPNDLLTTGKTNLTEEITATVEIVATTGITEITDIVAITVTTEIAEGNGRITALTDHLTVRETGQTGNKVEESLSEEMKTGSHSINLSTTSLKKLTIHLFD
jgi:hypothetical protein